MIQVQKGEELFAAGKVEEAERHFLGLARQDPENPEILNNLGVIHYAKGNARVASGYLLWALASKDDYQDALLNLIEVYRIRNQWEEVPAELSTIRSAAHFFQKINTLYPTDPTFYNDYGEYLYKRGMLQKAERAFHKALELNPNYADALFNLGRVYTSRRRFVEAVYVLRMCVAIDSSYEQAREALQECEKEDLIGYIRSDWKKILIVMDEGIGNMVMLTPVIRALQDVVPGARITVLGRRPSVEVLKGLGTEILTEPKKEASYDIGFYTIWSANLERCFGKKLRQQCRKRLYRIYMDNLELHEVEHHMKILRFLGYSDPTPHPYCAVEEAEVFWDESENVVALSDTTLDHPAWQRKRWPYYKQLAHQLNDMGYKVALVGGAVEEAKFDPEGWPDVYNVMGKYDIPGTAGVLKKCALFIGNDSGPAHISAALGIPTFVIFGPTRTTKNRPYGIQVQVITKDLQCSPCQYTQRWERCSDWKCMSQITVDDVVHTIHRYASGLENINASIPNTMYGNENIKKVLIVGVLDVPSSTNVFMKRGFERLGYQVDAYNYRTRLRELGTPEAMWMDFQQFLDGKRYELIVFSKVNGLDPELITFSNHFGKTWYWFMDNIEVARAIHADQYAMRADFASATSQEVVEWFRNINSRTYQIIEGFDPEVYYPEGLSKSYEVLFVGNATPKRIQELNEIRNGYHISIFGSGWPEDFRAQPPIYNDELRKTINQSRIVLNLVHSNIFSDRVVLSAASGGFVLSQYCPDLERHFMRKKHIDWFMDVAEAHKLIEYYLTHDNKREEIARCGMSFVRKNYNWDAICKTVLNELETSFRESPITPHKAPVKSVLFVSWHGLGDNVMLTPALRKYKEQYPDRYIAVAGLKRFGNTLRQLLSGLPFINEVIPCLSDAWNDYDNYQMGVNAVIQEAKRIAEEKDFDDLVVLPTNRQEGYKLHKIFRFGDEVGVQFHFLEDLQTELMVTDEAEKRVEDFVRDLPKPILVLHAKAGNQPKSLSSEIVERLISSYRGYTVLEFGQRGSRRSILVQENDMEFSKALIKRADMVVAIDSVVMHIAGAFKRPCLAVFTMTPVHQAIPLTYQVRIAGVDNERTVLAQWPDFKHQILEQFPPRGRSSDDRKEILEFLKNCYSPIPFEGYQANAVRDEGSHKRWNAMLPILSTEEPLKLLDIGCNLGFFSFSAANLGHRVIGIDTDEKSIHYARRIAELEEVSGVHFEHLSEGLLDYLGKIPDDAYDFVLYLSVHHHIYEQFDDKIANLILREISRIAKCMIFDMGQPDEKDNGWMSWLSLIPQFNDPKKDIIKHVMSNSGFQYGEVISSTTIHGTERWLYTFFTELPPSLALQTIEFNGSKYFVDKYIWRTEGSRGVLKSSHNSFPVFDPESETKVRYYKVSNREGKNFFIKEILYNHWLPVSPEEAAQYEFLRGQKLLNDEALVPYVVASKAINRNFLLFDYCDWPNLFQIEDRKNEISLQTCGEILDVAQKIYNKIDNFDLNPNNILYCDGSFKFIDFGHAGDEDWRHPHRLNSLRSFLDAAKECSKDLSKNFMEYKALFTTGPYGGRWEIEFGINDGDRVLDIGAGDRPYPFATDVIDLDTPEAEKQRYGRKLDKTRNLHLGKAEDILRQLKNNEFDFIYTSHALEHMDNLPLVLEEISRVGKRGFVIVPHYYMDLWCNNAETGHKWFLGYDHKRNVLKIRKRLPHEYIDELAKRETINWQDNYIQSHNTKTNIRALWEVRFYWEGSINFEIDEELFGASKYLLEKWNTGKTSRKHEIYCTLRESRSMQRNSKLIEVMPVSLAEGYTLKLPEFYHNPSCYWAHMVTFRCNGGCAFCILNGRGKHQRVSELSGEEILEFWNNLEHRPGQKLSLIGGEPTLHRDLVEIVNNLQDYDITITTNCKGPFYNNPNFHKEFKPRSSSTLRINTTFHPHFISAEDYISVIKKYRETGYFVDQTSYVYRPDINKYENEIKRVNEEIPITAAPYLGFYDSRNQFQAPFCPQYIEPNEDYYDLEAAARICGITDLEAFRDLCGQYEKKEAICIHPFRSLIIGPEGNYYHCHYKLYYGIDPVSNIKEFKPVTRESSKCRHYGFCNWCDVPRVGCVKNHSVRRMVLNKLYDKREITRSEITYLMSDIASFSTQHNMEFNPLKWFEYAYCLLYSGHRHRGRVLDVGSARSVFPYYLVAKGYDVTSIDIADADYRMKMGQKLNVKALTGDLRVFLPELEGTFDLVSNLSVIEHIDEDTKAILNLARYLKPGGIMVISTDFYESYIEYPDANRKIVKDRPAGSHTDSRVYTEETFLNRIILPLEQSGLRRLGLTNYRNVDIRDPGERAVRGLYTFGIACLINPIDAI